MDGLATGLGLFATVTTLVAALAQGNIALALATVPLAGAVVVFLIALYIMVGALQANITVSFISSGIVAAAAAFAIFYNLDHLRDARIPKQTLTKMKRR